MRNLWDTLQSLASLSILLQFPCHSFPSYEAPPPPSQPPPPSSGYSIYGAPPPPSPHKSGQSKCPPAAGVQCCTPPAPYTYGYGYGPPNPYTYVPYGEGQGPASMVLPILVPLIMLFSSIFLVWMCQFFVVYPRIISCCQYSIVINAVVIYSSCVAPCGIYHILSKFPLWIPSLVWIW